ncbi:DUF3304 domain-containing protein [Paraburkholderia lycopersici]|uniref:DUF3304 domain-containing protein n=1 Tax=Paraburkholderia lycopersici TaxID=416944 RepID=A0A1G6Q0D2_9BURK|nr:DUF3304 domain-containing protein [Paraburkholderia lycopersici]SDC85813.1 Protein of unknown function [Paraburkholderia lycopersici]
MNLEWADPMPVGGRVAARTGSHRARPGRCDKWLSKVDPAGPGYCRHTRLAALILVTAMLAGLSGCKEHANRTSSIAPAKPPARLQMVDAQTATLNYAPWYVHEWGIEGPTDIVGANDEKPIEGTGPQAYRAASSSDPEHGDGKYCCIRIPAVWQPDLRLTVRWLVDRKQDGLNPNAWYKAENVRIPKYEKPAGDVWAVFLPDGRVRIMVPDGAHGANDPAIRPGDDDPYIAQGAPDEEWDRRYVRGSALSPIDYANLPKRVDMAGAPTSTLNYTPWYIHTWGFEGPANIAGREGRQYVGGGGPNVMPARSGDRPGGGGKETCCSNIPAVWQPDLRLTVRWLVYKKEKNTAQTSWYKAEHVRLARYGEILGAVWAVFLPGDRVRIMVADGNKYGGNDINNRPPDNDPYIAQGVPDEEWNRLYRDGGNTQ